MRNSYQPASALPSLAGGVLLALSVLCGSVSAESALQNELLADLEAFEAERSAYRRLLPGDEGLSVSALSAYRETLLQASGRWIERWPAREFAWRARLQALLGVERRLPEEAWPAVQAALWAACEPSGIAYDEPIQLLAARALVHHQTHLKEARQLAEAGLAARLAFLDQLASRREAAAVEEIQERKRVWRWKAAVISVRAAAIGSDLSVWRTALADLANFAPERPAPGDRDSAIAFAAAALEIHLQRARFALAVGRPEAAIEAYRRAVSLRPAFPGRIEPPANQAALKEASAAWLAAGGARDEWESWIKSQKGFPIPRRER